MSDPARRCNIASALRQMASETPDRLAVVVAQRRAEPGDARYTEATYVELEAGSNRYADRLIRLGLQPGCRTLLMVRPGLEFTALSFALLKIGAVPVLIDPGMGIRRMLQCIRQVQPQALIGVRRACLLRWMNPSAFRSVRRTCVLGRKWSWARTVLGPAHASDVEICQMAPSDPAAIIFTSGSTGPAKGVTFAHDTLQAQAHAIQSHYRIRPGEVELATFALFALFCPLMGTTCVFPVMDFSHPARVDPARVVATILDRSVTSAFGSPALWGPIVDYCANLKIKLAPLRRVLIAGAAVHWKLVSRLRGILDASAEIHTPYGATEALPVCSVSAHEILGPCLAQTRNGAGTCVGKPIRGVAVRIIRITDEPLGQWSNDLLMTQGQVGEIVVSGNSVTRAYWGLEQATALAKIPDGNRLWHRMGDVGYLDDQGRLWYCGRKSQRVQTTQLTLFTEQCEAIYNEHSAVHRSALVGVGQPGRQRPVMVIELRDKLRTKSRKKFLTRELLQLGRRHPRTREIEQLLLHDSFPVDPRHNAKINREALAGWANRQ